MEQQDTTINYRNVVQHIQEAAQKCGRNEADVQLVAVSKTYFAEAITPILEAGQRAFGENRVQEAQQKWPALRDQFPDVELRLIGPLQSNKVADAVALFDVIESVDRPKIARALAFEMQKQPKSCKIFIQVNTGLEEQKAGITPDDVETMVALCRDELQLDVQGLMCIPPFEENPGPHFALLRKLAHQNNLGKLSMGMSGDFETAIEFGATSVRVGSAIFGARK